MVIPTRFWKSVGVVMVGTGLAQIILVAATPVLSRLFDDVQIGMLTAFLVLPNALLPAIGGKFEVAMVLPRSERTARILTGFAVQICLLTSVLLLIWTLSPIESGGRFAVYEPLYLFLAGNVLILQYGLNRSDQFARLGHIKIVIAAATISMMLVAGWLGAGTGGLIAGSLVGQMVGLAMLLRWGMRPRGIVPITFRSARATLRRYREYPTFNASSGLFSGFTLALPVLAIERWCSDAELGQFGMMIRVTAAPAALAMVAIGHVNLRVVSRLSQEGGSALRHVLRTSGVLWMIAIPGAVVTAIWGPALFAFVLGENWREAGRFAAILAPAIAARFAVAPLSTTLGATQHNRLGMTWRLTAFVATAAAVLTVGPQGDVGVILSTLAITEVGVYLLLLGFVLHAAARPAGDPSRRRQVDAAA